MAEIGYGYGSEFQLLRFLGHHRIELENNIRKNSQLKGRFQWLDFPYDSQRISMDGEYKGISFLKERDDYPILKEKWAKFWPNTGNQQNWDAILKHDENMYVLIEAKAHLKEIESNISSTVKDSSKKAILDCFDKTQKHFDIQIINDWTQKYYQLANRLAFAKFLIDNNIQVQLLNLYFMNGYLRRCYEDKKSILEDKGVTTEEVWKIAIKKQYDYLGISNSKAMDYIISIFIDCKK